MEIIKKCITPPRVCMLGILLAGGLPFGSAGMRPGEINYWLVTLGIVGIALVIIGYRWMQRKIKVNRERVKKMYRADGIGVHELSDEKQAAFWMISTVTAGGDPVIELKDMIVGGNEKGSWRLVVEKI